jgi:hypothetical protein
LLASLVASAPARAALFFCSQGFGPGTPGFDEAYDAGSWLCASSHTAGEGEWSPSVLAPDAAAEKPVEASQTGSAGGDFGATASASSNAAPGVVRGNATAVAFGNGEAGSSADAEASFLERGPLQPIGGATPGAPVTLHLTIDVGGIFLGQGAGGDVALAVYRNGTVAYERPVVVNALHQGVADAVDLPGFVVGDDVALYLRLRTFAAAVDEPEALSSATADLGDSARIYLDVASGNARFDAASGHDYGFVPEPAGPALLGVGAVVLAAARRRRDSSGTLAPRC